MATALATRAERSEPASELLDRAGVPSWDGLTVGREDIRFHTVRPGVLAIEITIRNSGAEWSSPSVAMLRSAPLGAFVPWRPLGVVRVPAIEPGGSAVVRHEARYRTPAALGGADKPPPGRVLTALGLDDRDADRPQSELPADPLSLFGRGGVHWAGNLNIFFPGKDVERHLAQALRIYPGRVNLAMFIVGDRGPGAYRFRLTGDGASWAARLVDMRSDDLVGVMTDKGGGIEPGVWTRPATGMLMLAIEPPPDATTGAVNVHVEQQSTGREAVVEFSLDAGAAGPGCYVV